MNTESSHFARQKFSVALKSKRKFLGLKLRDAAKIIGVSTYKLSQCENQQTPYLDTYFLCCQWLGVPIQEYFPDKPKIDDNVKVKMSICPGCGSAIRVSVEHEMDEEMKKEFAAEVFEYDLQVKTISLEEYRASNITLYCKPRCPRKVNSKLK